MPVVAAAASGTAKANRLTSDLTGDREWESA
jgi:hypothetical protein